MEEIDIIVRFQCTITGDRATALLVLTELQGGLGEALAAHDAVVKLGTEQITLALHLTDGPLEDVTAEL